MTAGLDKSDTTWLMPDSRERAFRYNSDGRREGGGGVCVNHPVYMTKEVVY